jgi:hypothetical protein
MINVAKNAAMGKEGITFIEGDALSINKLGDFGILLLPFTAAHELY